MKSIKIVVVGDGAVGKTSLLMAHANNEFNDGYAPTTMDAYTSFYKVKNEEFQVLYYDTAGQEDYARLRPLAYPQADIVIICFSTVNYDSFYNVEVVWVPEVRCYLPDTPILLVGTQIDLRDDQGVTQNSRAPFRRTQYVNSRIASDRAKHIKAAGYVECSAKANINVDEVFNKAIKAAIKKKHSDSNSCIIL